MFRPDFFLQMPPISNPKPLKETPGEMLTPSYAPVHHSLGFSNSDSGFFFLANLPEEGPPCPDIWTMKPSPRGVETSFFLQMPPLSNANLLTEAPSEMLTPSYSPANPV